MSNIKPEQVQKLKQLSKSLHALSIEEAERKITQERNAARKREKEKRERVKHLKKIKGSRQGFNFTKENLVETVHWLENHSAIKYQPDIYLIDQKTTNIFKREHSLASKLDLSLLPSMEGIIFLSESIVSGHEVKHESIIVPSESDSIKTPGEPIETVTALLWAHKSKSVLLNLSVFQANIFQAEDILLPETIRTRVSLEIPTARNTIDLTSSNITLIEQKLYQMFGYILTNIDTPRMITQRTQEVKNVHFSSIDPADVQTITISNYKNNSSSSDPEGRIKKSQREYSHRFDVRGHYRNIRVSKDSEETKKIWVEGYVKGSTEKPYVKKKRIWKIQ
ncbi:hypothetical protein [Rothia nasimurium]|uniref:hypothetical protein n=1 Tax=Rothia nasimurium TaxID=85336 RepID=UPI001F240D75|nr:hypothetical protein [Rothia nasimurium]